MRNTPIAFNLMVAGFYSCGHQGRIDHTARFPDALDDFVYVSDNVAPADSVG